MSKRTNEQLEKALECLLPNQSDEERDRTMQRVGEAICQFLDAQRLGRAQAPESFLIDLPAKDFDAGRTLFDVVELLKSNGVEQEL